jgi:hypothetical protein
VRTEEQYRLVQERMQQYRELLERVVNAYDTNQFKPLDDAILEVRCVIGSVSRKAEFIPNDKLAGGIVPEDAIVPAHEGIGSKKLRCKNGHLATAENTYLEDGRAMCRTCRVERS